MAWTVLIERPKATTLRVYFKACAEDKPFDFASTFFMLNDPTSKKQLLAKIEESVPMFKAFSKWADFRTAAPEFEVGRSDDLRVLIVHGILEEEDSTLITVSQADRLGLMGLPMNTPMTCVACGCASESDKQGERTCYCDTCMAGCVSEKVATAAAH